MYMDQNEHLLRRDRAGREMMQFLAQSGSGCGEQAGRMSRGCDGRGRCGDVPDGMARAEGLVGNNGAQGDGCGCGEQGVIGNSHPCGENGVEGRSLAMVYAPIQSWGNIYDPQTALTRGTLFRELDMPFFGDKKADRGGNCRGY